MSGTVTNTALSQRLKVIFNQGLERKEKAREDRAEAAKAAKKAKKPPPPGPHLDESAQLVGVLGKGDNYARRAYVYLKAKDGRGIYKDFAFAHLSEIREMVEKIAKFPDGPKENFNPTYAQQHPYAWRAHHMLPGSAFYYELDGKPVFSFKQLRMILQTDYNINHGHNLILLPFEDWACPVHTLLCHPSDHEQYTIKIVKDLKRVADDLQKKIDEAGPHDGDKLKADIFEQLKNAEEDAWKFIVKLSRVAIPMACRGLQFQHPSVKWQTEDKKYDFPALG
jgi:A nuclease family of the HNH/ENDO VII superfamily with conserved AHH